MPQVMIYLTQSCPFCNMAKRLLDTKGVQYETIDIGNDRDQWAAMEAKTGRNTVPQVYVGDTHIGGFDELSATDKSGQLDQLLNG